MKPYTVFFAAAVIPLGLWLSGRVWPVALTTNAVGDSGSCNAAIWPHLHTPSRFRRPIFYAYPCVTVQGRVVDVHELASKDGGDGDYGFQMLNEKTGKGIHVEIVCAHRPEDYSAVEACRGYHNEIPQPTLGQRILVTGWWVIDKGHGLWEFQQEIHPVSSLTILPTAND